MSESDQPENDDDSTDVADDAVDGGELSLDELGRAYAKAVGLVPDKPPPIESETPPPIDDDSFSELSPKTILEALLFVGTPDEDSPLTTRKIAAMIRDVTPKEITQLAKKLQKEYEESGSAFRVERDKNQLRLVLAEEFEVIRENFYGEVRTARLSQQSIDVLAIAAYNQPVTKERINELRFRDCSGIINQLIKRQLLVVHESPESKGKKEYRTTDRFLDLFGLETLDDLPQSEESMLPDIED